MAICCCCCCCCTCCCSCCCCGAAGGMGPAHGPLGRPPEPGMGCREAMPAGGPLTLPTLPSQADA
eukprot:363847-Chlamydomonas_euryale.AAC.4